MTWLACSIETIMLLWEMCEIFFVFHGMLFMGYYYSKNLIYEESQWRRLSRELKDNFVPWLPSIFFFTLDISHIFPNVCTPKPSRTSLISAFSLHSSNFVLPKDNNKNVDHSYREHLNGMGLFRLRERKLKIWQVYILLWVFNEEGEKKCSK